MSYGGLEGFNVVNAIKSTKSVNQLTVKPQDLIQIQSPHRQASLL